LLALPVLWGLWRARQRQQNVWRGVVDAHLLPHLLEKGGDTIRGALWMGALGYALAILALAGPSWRQGEQPLWQSQSPLVVALDLSSSITASDLPPSRLLQARAKLATLLRERAGGQVALVVYAGEAFTVAPLTDDAANLELFLDALEPGVMPVDGQRADKAIAWSVRLLRQAGFERGDILLVSGHADAVADAAAVDASRQGFRVSALGLGTAAGAPYRDADGRIVHARLDAGSLRALGTAGGGNYQTISVDDSDLRALGVLDPGESGATPQRGEKGLAWRDEGYWLLPLLMLLALFAFRRGGAFAAVVVCVCLPLAMPAHAAESSLWKRSDQQQHERIEQGVDAYHKGDFASAGKAFAGIDSADAFYNQGNALAKQGRYDEAIAAYDQALQRQPKMEDAIENRKTVDAARKRKNGQGQNQKNQQQGDQQKPKQSSGQGSPQDAKDKQPPPPSGSPPSPPGSAPPEPAPQKSTPPKFEAGQSPEQKAADAKAQQAADAAQRERMAKAMAQAGNEKQKRAAGGQAAVAETAGQREQRQAVEAWLRRVPDEPGGLLKTKFRLEYERRQKEGQ
ncbi:MAG TPA: VWA domain-containing protein, partial [Pseudoxanthomonas sp.]|nr:VWA domain-containing protein [Pseudoxanthomonas sp.]